jgi:hypothetical protein
VSVDEIADRLYALPLEEFTQARNRAASELRREGRGDEAEQVKALRKPTAAAAAVNRLVREQRGDVEQFLRAATALRDAQFAGKGDLAAATKEERDALQRLTRAGGEAVRQSLLAAAVDEGAAERLLEPRGFGTLLSHVPSPAARAKKATPPRPQKRDDGRARAKLRRAQAALEAAEQEEEEARRRWERAGAELEKARAAVVDARRRLDLLRDA